MQTAFHDQTLLSSWYDWNTVEKDVKLQIIHPSSHNMIIPFEYARKVFTVSMNYFNCIYVIAVMKYAHENSMYKEVIYILALSNFDCNWDKTQL